MSIREPSYLLDESLAEASLASIRQHTSTYVSIRQPSYLLDESLAEGSLASIRQHTSAYVSIRQHTSAYVSIRQHTSAYVSPATCWTSPLPKVLSPTTRPLSRSCILPATNQYIYIYVHLLAADMLITTCVLPTTNQYIYSSSMYV